MNKSELKKREAEEYAKKQAEVVWESWITDSTTEVQTEYEYSKQDDDEDF